AQSRGKGGYRARIIHINAQDGSVQRALYGSARCGYAIISRRTLTKIQETIGAKSELIRLMITFAGESGDYRDSFIGDIVSIGVAKTNNASWSAYDIARDKQVSVGSKSQSQWLRQT